MTQARAPQWLLVALVTVFVGTSPVAGQQEIFAQGNQFYQAEDYAAAIEAYEAVRAGGFESTGLHYNLGNAYFKTGELGRSILNWERALRLSPGNADASANLALAISLSTDDIEPLPRFWLFSAASWWVDLLPRPILVISVLSAWLALTGGILIRVLSRVDGLRRSGGLAIATGSVLMVVLGSNLALNEFGVGQAERGVILAEAVWVRSAPTDDDDLTVFEVHEGTRVRIDQRTEQWAEIVLDDGKVGWVPVGAMEVI